MLRSQHLSKKTEKVCGSDIHSRQKHRIDFSRILFILSEGITSTHFLNRSWLNGKYIINRVDISTASACSLLLHSFFIASVFLWDSGVALNTSGEFYQFA